jgi:hypothetical protein
MLDDPNCDSGAVFLVHAGRIDGLMTWVVDPFCFFPPLGTAGVLPQLRYPKTRNLRSVALSCKQCWPMAPSTGWCINAHRIEMRGDFDAQESWQAECIAFIGVGNGLPPARLPTGPVTSVVWISKRYAITHDVGDYRLAWIRRRGNTQELRR